MSNFVCLNATCKVVIHKYAKNPTGINVAHIPKRIGYGWKEMMSGEEIVEFTIPNLSKLLESIKCFQ
jgi:hypothetical protein